MSDIRPAEWETFSGRLAWVLQVLHIDREEVDRRLGKDSSSRWTRGSKPHPKNMHALCTALGVLEPWLARNQGMPFRSGMHPPREMTGPGSSQDDAIALVADVVHWLNGARKPTAREVEIVRKLVARLADGRSNTADGDGED